MDLLVINGIELSPYAVRGLTQQLTLIPQASNLRRDINGVLNDVSSTRFQKYASSIQANDMVPPAFDEIYPGTQITVDCIAEIGYSATSPSRTAVPGSIRSEDGYKFFRPRLTMLVTNWTVNRDEYGQVVGWQLDSEEQ